MNQLTCFIIDDLESINQITKKLEKFSDLKLIGSAQNSDDGLKRGYNIIHEPNYKGGTAFLFKN
jgi:hypothetical protein